MHFYRIMVFRTIDTGDVLLIPLTFPKQVHVLLSEYKYIPTDNYQTLVWLFRAYINSQNIITMTFRIGRSLEWRVCCRESTIPFEKIPRRMNKVCTILICITLDGFHFFCFSSFILQRRVILLRVKFSLTTFDFRLMEAPSSQTQTSGNYLEGINKFIC